MSKRWIKVPGPGDFRGEGEWKTIEEAGCPLADWEWNRETAYLRHTKATHRPRNEIGLDAPAPCAKRPSSETEP
jgi:hypothetical protein